MSLTAQKHESTKLRSGVLTGLFGRQSEPGGEERQKHHDFLKGLDRENDLRHAANDPLHDDHRPRQHADQEGLDTRLVHDREKKLFRTLHGYNVDDWMDGTAEDPDISIENTGYRKPTATQSLYDIAKLEEEEKDGRLISTTNAIRSDAVRLQAILERMEEVREEMDELNEEMQARMNAEDLLDDEDINAQNVGGRYKRNQLRQNLKDSGMDDADVAKIFRADGTVDKDAAREILQSHRQDQQQRMGEYKQELDRLQAKADALQEKTDGIMRTRGSDPEAVAKMKEIAQTQMGANVLVASAAKAADSGALTDEQECEAYEIAGLDARTARNLVNADSLEEFLALDMEGLNLDRTPDLMLSSLPEAANEESYTLVGDENDALSKIGKITPLFAVRASETAADVAQRQALEQQKTQPAAPQNAYSRPAMGMAAAA